MIATDKRMRLNTCLLVCTLIFIWGNSLLPGRVSGAVSDWVNEILSQFFSAEPETEGSGLLRKLAHFTEFAALGMLLSWRFGMLKKAKPFAWICGTAAACVDETIQIFVPDRGPSLWDVLLDSCGVATGMLLLYLGHTYYTKKKQTHLEDKKMKKMLALMLALAMVLAMTACGKKAEPVETTAAVEVPASALEIFQNIWDAYGEEEKFAVMGGGMANPVDGAPGEFPLDDEAITYALLIPAEQLTNVTEVASLSHMMNANTFTGAVYKLADGVTAADFGAAMRDAVMNNQWMCGFPDSLLIQDIAGAYVLVAFGKNEPMTSLETHLKEIYPDSTVLTNESIA